MFVGEPPKRGPTVFVQQANGRYRPATGEEILGAAGFIRYRKAVERSTKPSRVYVQQLQERLND